MEKKEVTHKSTNARITGPVVLLKDSWATFAEMWKKLLILTILPYLALIPFGIVVALFVLAGFMLYSTGNLVGVIALSAVGIILAIVYLSIVFSVGYIAMIIAISERSKKLSIKELLKKGWSIIWSYWALAFISSLLIMGGYLLFIIPGIIFSIWFSFALYILVVEGVKGMAAILRSREYVRGYWFGILGRILFITLITYAVMFGSTYLFSLIKQDTIGGIIQFLISIAITPFTVIYSLLIYESLKKIKPDIASIKTGGKGLYIAVAVLGLCVLIVISYFVILIGISAYEGMQDDMMYGPTQRTFEVAPPDIT